MINTEDFIKRLEIIFEHYGLSAASFSDKIGVQRSGISHLLSGRNKPSLDFVLKIIHYFPDVDLYWLISGKGNLIKSTQQDQITESGKTIIPVSKEVLKSKVTTEKIIVFYSDGTFSEHKPKL